MFFVIADKCFTGYYWQIKGWTDKTKWSGSHCHSWFQLTAHQRSYTLKLCWLQGLFMIWMISFHIFRLTEHTIYVRFTSQFILELCSKFRQNVKRVIVEKETKWTCLFFAYYLHAFMFMLDLRLWVCWNLLSSDEILLLAFCWVSCFCQLLQFESTEGKVAVEG